MLKHGKDKEVKQWDTKQRDRGRTRRKKKKFECSSMHFWKELHQFLQVYTAEKNNFHSNLLKISKSLKYNMNVIIQRTFKKAEDP